MNFLISRMSDPRHIEERRTLDHPPEPAFSVQRDEVYARFEKAQAAAAVVQESPLVLWASQELKQSSQEPGEARLRPFSHR